MLIIKLLSDNINKDDKERSSKRELQSICSDVEESEDNKNKIHETFFNVHVFFNKLTDPASCTMDNRFLSPKQSAVYSK